MRLRSILQERWGTLASFSSRNRERLKWLATDRGYRLYVVRKLRAELGYVDEHWVRIAMNRSWSDFLDSVDPGNLDAVEISPGTRKTWAQKGFRSYSALTYPEFDICENVTSRRYSVVIADNVFEHLRRPYQAARNVREMLDDGGFFLISTPFLVRVHGSPGDYSRWTEAGLRCLLEESGFSADRIRTYSWGNRKCVAANLDDWASLGWRRNLRNEPNLPVTVWAIAEK